MRSEEHRTQREGVLPEAMMKAAWLAVSSAVIAIWWPFDLASRSWQQAVVRRIRG